MKQHPIHKEYSCDDFGNVYKNGKLLKGTVTTTGYRQYRIDRKSILGHRLVTECRIGRKLETAEVVNHLNLDKLDNSVTNLEITDSRGNRIHYWNAKVIDTSNIDFSDVVDLMVKTISWQHLADSVASKSIAGLLMRYVTNSELESLINAWSFFETIHART